MFPVVLRGYDRAAVDAYVLRITELVAELQAVRSPKAAVKKALDRVGRETASPRSSPRKRPTRRPPSHAREPKSACARPSARRRGSSATPTSG